MKIMIVDDDESIVEVLSLMLSEFQVIKAYSGREAVIMYKLLKPDLVLMDIIMPDLSGDKATREILKFDPGAKIIGITAYEKHKGDEMLEAGVLDLLLKPFRKSQLVETVKKYIDIKYLDDER
jgi:two-component system response regulator/two-component system chemotaxis response regulator CheY